MPDFKSKSPFSWQRLSYFIVFIVGIGVGQGWYQYTQPERVALADGQAVEVLFSPKGGVTNFVVRQLDQAQEHIYVFAYSLTSQPIANALIRAYKRGVKVYVIADKSRSAERGSQLPSLHQAGISVRIWKGSSASLQHNKVMIIDRQRVLTGSFNWSSAAEHRNAENLVGIYSKELAKIYLENWNSRAKGSVSYE